jgi:hypothetical protein
MLTQVTSHKSQVMLVVADSRLRFTN